MRGGVSNFPAAGPKQPKLRLRPEDRHCWKNSGLASSSAEGLASVKPRAFITRVCSALNLKGFFATPNTEHACFNYTLGCATITLSPEH